MKSDELRQKFLNFFEKKSHTIVSSSSLIPADSSVLFTTAGMQQFKPYYLGEKSPYGSRVVSCQKCFRTSDIEEVGNNRHLTFLEMLGNFSFNDYFKREAIEWAYEFIAKKLGVEIDYVSVFSGDKEVPEDKESEKIWLDLGIPKDKINIEATPNGIEVKAEHDETKEEKGKNWLRRECSGMSFYRALEFPEEVKTDNIDAELRDGILKLKLPKIQPKPEHKAKKVQIK